MSRALVLCAAIVAAMWTFVLSPANASDILDEDSGPLAATCIAHASPPDVELVSPQESTVEMIAAVGIKCSYRQYSPDIVLHGWLSGYVGGNTVFSGSTD